MTATAFTYKKEGHKMKHPKTVTVLLFAAMLLSLCACGSGPAGSPSPAPEASSAPALTPVPTAEPSAAPEPVEAPEPSAEPEPEAEPEADSDQKNTALGLVGSDVSALYDAVGYPISSSYAPSCLGDGEDGELVYDGFTVYTFKAASGGETISVVL